MSDYSWIQHGASTYPDRRLAARLLRMRRDWADAHADETSRILDQSAKRKGADRLIKYENISLDEVPESHRYSTVLRCAQQPVVLAVQDSLVVQDPSTMNPDVMKYASWVTVHGIVAHCSVAFTGDGSRVLGVMDIDGQFFSRAREDDQVRESIRWVKGLELAGQLSVACALNRPLIAEGDKLPATRVVSVCDPEGDIRELFERQHALADQVGLLVGNHGSRHHTVVLDDGAVVALPAHLESLDPVVKKEVVIGAQGGKRAREERTATVSLRIAKVQLRASQNRKAGTGSPSLPVIAVSVKEDQPPGGIKSPLNWLLICTEGEADADNAARICRWYETRWRIKEYFRVLKRGYKIEEDLYTGAGVRSERMALHSVVAWRVFGLQRCVKLEPDRLATEVVEPEESEICQILLNDKYPDVPVRAPPDLTTTRLCHSCRKTGGIPPNKKKTGSRIQIIMVRNILVIDIDTGN